VLPDTAQRFARAIVMPNLRPRNDDRCGRRLSRPHPRCSACGQQFLAFDDAVPYRQYPAQEIRAAKSGGFVHAVKYYPAGATTNSDAGVTDIRRCFDTFETMAEIGMPLLIHGETTDTDVDVFDREKVFIERTLIALVQRFPRLKIVVEHITTADAVKFVLGAPNTVAATITAHHLLLNRNDLFRGGIRPHHYCLPVPKREEHRQALVKAAISGTPKFFLGTDSAPHARHAKETGCGCAGIYTAHGGSSCTRDLRGGRSARQTGGLCRFLRRRLLRPAAQSRTHHTEEENLAGAGGTALRGRHPGAIARRRFDRVAACVTQTP